MIAEAELDIDYRGSPIVMGDRHEALRPGQRLADTVEICLADGVTCGLHELTNRPATLRLLIGGPLADEIEFARLESYLIGTDLPFLEATFAFDGPTRAPTPPPACSRSRRVGNRGNHAAAHSARWTCRPPAPDRDHIQTLAAYAVGIWPIMNRRRRFEPLSPATDTRKASDVAKMTGRSSLDRFQAYAISVNLAQKPLPRKLHPCLCLSNLPGLPTSPCSL